MKYKTMFKVDFKEARESAGLEIPVVEKIARGVGHEINLAGIESNSIKPSPSDVSLLMSIYNTANGENNNGSSMKF